jgi:hypothetical protein
MKPTKYTLIFTVIIAPAFSAGTMHFYQRPCAYDDHCFYLLAQGEIGPETPSIFEQSVAPNIRAVHFDSPGGSLNAGIALGRAIRRQGLNTYVDENAVCASACGYAFAGGRERRLSERGVLAVHQFYSPGQDSGESVAQSTVAMLGAYLDEMGVSRKLLDMASLVKPDT